MTQYSQRKNKMKNYNYSGRTFKKKIVLTINWLMAGAALATVLMTLVDWTCPITTMFMDIFSAPIFGFVLK